MAVTANGTHIIFNDNSTQEAKGSVLGSIQYGSYVSYTRATASFTTFSTSETLSYYTGVPFVMNYVGSGYIQESDMTKHVSVGTSTVFCGWAIYRSATTNNDSGGVADSGTIQVRYSYRSIS